MFNALRLKLPVLKQKLLFLSIVLPIITAAAVVFLTSGCSSSAEIPPPEQVDTSSPTTRAKGPITQEAVERMITRKMGNVGVNNQPLIRKVSLIPEADGIFVDIHVNRPPSCHLGIIVTYTVDMSKQFMSALFLYPDVAKVQLNLYGTTDEVADKDKLAARVVVNRASAEKIDWFNFNAQTAPQLATEYWIEPTIYGNWQQYGGEAITDPALRAAANAGVTTKTAP